MKMTSNTTESDAHKTFFEDYSGELTEELKHEYSVLQNIAKEATPEDASCSICFEKLEFDNENAVMGCRHIFCFGCIQDWISNRQKEDSVSCPTCRTETPIVHKANPKNDLGTRVVPVDFPPRKRTADADEAYRNSWDFLFSVLTSTLHRGAPVFNQDRGFLVRSRAFSSNGLPLQTFTSAPRDQPSPPDDLSDIDGDRTSDNEAEDDDSEADMYDEYHFVDSSSIVNNTRGNVVWTSTTINRFHEDRQRHFDEQMRQAHLILPPAVGGVTQLLTTRGNYNPTRAPRTYSRRPRTNRTQANFRRTLPTRTSIPAPNQTQNDNTPSRPYRRTIASLSGPVDLL